MTQIVNVDDSATSSGRSGMKPYSRPSYSGYRRRRYGYKRRRSTFVRRKPRRRMVRRKLVLSRFIMAHIDPFSVDAVGCKVPDSNTYPSHGFPVSDDWGTDTTDANGLIAKAYLPNLKASVVTHVSATGHSWTWAPAFGGTYSSDKYANIVNQYEMYRPVAHGVRISCPAAVLSLTGQVHVAIVAVSQFASSTWEFPTSVAQLSNCLFYKRYSLSQLTQGGVTIVNKFLDCTSTRYIDVASTAIESGLDVTFQTNGWAAILVCVEGAPATSSVINAESILHCEAVPRANAVNAATPAAAYNIADLQRVSRMAGETPASFTDSARHEYFSEVQSALTQGVYSAGNTLFNNVVLPGAYALGKYAVNRAVGGIPGLTNRPHMDALM